MELEKAKKILNGNTNEKYNDEEVKQILEFVNVLATVSMNVELKKKKANNEKCNSLR